MIDDCNPQEVIHMHFQMLQILPLPVNVKFKHSKIWRWGIAGPNKPKDVQSYVAMLKKHVAEFKKMTQ